VGTTSPDTGRDRAGSRPPADPDRGARDAWERFVGGADEVEGVPSPVLLSWYRSRDVYKVDPRDTHAPVAARARDCAPRHEGVSAMLGGVAAALVRGEDHCLSTVTDGDGRILARWGDEATLRRAEESNLAPFFRWSESAIGTNGMGTALSQTAPVVVRGPQHWCAALHDWYCTGLAVHDPVTGEPLGAVNVSSWRREVPVTPHQLRERTREIRRELRTRALRAATGLTEAFVAAQRRTRSTLVALDPAGRVVAVSGTAGPRPAEPVPGQPAAPPHPELRELARLVTERAAAEPDWTGSAELGFLVGRRHQVFAVRPVASTAGLAGVLLSDEPPEPGAEPLDGGQRAAVAPRADGVPKRVLAVRADHIVLLSPEEIRYAEAARHDVWLVTDRGRMRAVVHGIDNLERELAPFGFLRVHRGYVVNLARIREIAECGNGTLTLSTDPRRREAIAVSRRCAIKLRRQLGF
jgi:sigma-54 dependent transcriptional regulator, acetoin dehydrogenase operon transcriptional activator AcoR